jgi:hypothetical protein
MVSQFTGQTKPLSSPHPLLGDACVRATNRPGLAQRFTETGPDGRLAPVGPRMPDVCNEADQEQGQMPSKEDVGNRPEVTTGP